MFKKLKPLFISHGIEYRALQESEKKGLLVFLFLLSSFLQENKHSILKFPGTDEAELTCQAEG